MNALGDIYSLYNIYKSINNIKNNPHEPISRETCQKLKQQIIGGGCIYIKFTQWLVSKLRKDQGKGIEMLTNSLDSLFDQCPYHELEHTQELFRQSFGGRELESEVSDLELIASGSVGQVYRGILNKPYVVCTKCDAMVSTRIVPIIDGQQDAKTILVCKCPPITNTNINNNNSSSEDDGDDNCDGNASSMVYGGDPKYIKVIRKVAIKIKHPNIDKQIADKMQVFKFMATLQKIKWVKNLLSLHVDFKDFMDNLTRQADFQEELQNNRRLRYNFRNNHLVYFPLALTASRDVLISEYVSGQSMDNIGEYQQMKCCLNYASMVAQMVLIDNFCHADLHRGNWCISLGPIPSISDQSIDASTVHLPRNIDSYLDHDPSKENTILHIKGDLRNNATPPRSPTAHATNNTNGGGDYAIIVFDAGICFSNTDIEVSQKIWEAFERSSLDYLLEIVDYIVVGDYDETIKDHVREILGMFRDDFNGILPMFDKLNEVLATYNCRLSTIALNITVLFSLINDTLERHNLVGVQDQGGKHNDIIRSKMLDIICYGKSRGIYTDLIQYLKNKENTRHNDLVMLDNQNGDNSPSSSTSGHSDVELFGKACASTLVFGDPDDLLDGLSSDSDDNDDNRDNDNDDYNDNDSDKISI